MPSDQELARDYLSGWANPERHIVTFEDFRDNVIARCSCGWSDVPVMFRSLASRSCPVQEVLAEREERMRRFGADSKAV